MATNSQSAFKVWTFKTLKVSFLFNLFQQMKRAILLIFLFPPELDISTDRIPPSESCHKLTLNTLKLKNHATPLTIQFPWPFLADDIKSTLYRRKPATENNSTVMIILKKSINDPWPDEFSNRPCRGMSTF